MMSWFCSLGRGATRCEQGGGVGRGAGGIRTSVCASTIAAVGKEEEEETLELVEGGGGITTSVCASTIAGSG